jgi:hypothetical protein
VRQYRWKKTQLLHRSLIPSPVFVTGLEAPPTGPSHLAPLCSHLPAQAHGNNHHRFFSDSELFHFLSPPRTACANSVPVETSSRPSCSIFYCFWPAGWNSLKKSVSPVRPVHPDQGFSCLLFRSGRYHYYTLKGARLTSIQIHSSHPPCYVLLQLL